MDLKAALNTCLGFTDPKHLQWKNVGAIGDVLFASNGISGCEVPCPSLGGLEFTVEAKRWTQQVAALADPKITIDGENLVTSAKGAKFTIQIDREAAMPTRRDAPKKGWRDVDAGIVQMLAEIGRFVADKANAQFVLTAIRLTPTWMAAGNSNRIAICWSKGVVEQPTLVQPFMFDGLGGSISICVQATSFWTRTPEDGVRWAAALEGTWPDEALSALVAARAGMYKFAADGSELARIAALACVEFDGVGGLAMEGTGKALRLRGAGVGSISTVSAAMDVEADLDFRVGINPAYLGEAAGLARAAVGGGQALQMTVGDSTSPVLLRNGDVEVLIMPTTLS